MVDRKATNQPIQIGWVVDAPFGDFAFKAPYSLRKGRQSALSSRAVQACPAVNELEKRIFVVDCAFDIYLTIEKKNDQYHLFSDEKKTKIDPDALGKFLTFMPQKLWRRKDRPVLQILLPYFFLCDEQCYMTQIPPFLGSNMRFWPGTLISARFPITNWPRILNWAFEWEDITKPLRLKRGEPISYFSFESNDPSRNIKMVEAKNSDKVKQFRKGISGMPKYLSNTFSVMEEAASRRPKNLLEEASDD